MKQYHKKGSIRKKLLLIIVIIISIASAVGYSAFVFWYLKNQQIRSFQLAKMASGALSQDIAKLILLDDVTKASDISSELSFFPSIASMVLYKKNGVAIYKYERNLNSKSQFFSFKIDAKYNDIKLGYIKFKIKKESIWEIFEDDLLVLVAIYFIIILLSFILATIFSKQFTAPVLRLVKFLDKVEYDKTDKRLYINDKTEYGLLYEEINEMLERIQKAKDELKLSAVAFETQSGMLITDSKEKILRVNKAFSKITGYAPDEIIGKTPAVLKSKEQDEKFYTDMKKSLKKFHYWNGEIYVLHKNGKVYPLHLTIQSVFDDNGKLMYYVSSFIDISIEKEAQAKLEYFKKYDSLTGFANRELFVQTIQNFLNKQKQKGWGCIISLNIKDFKGINDIFGYKRGDILLQKIANRLKSEFKECDLIGKIGADEFVLWFSHISDTKQNAQIQSQMIVEYLMAVLKKSYVINNKIIHIATYIGIELYDKYSGSAAHLIKHADTALSLAKNKDVKFAYFDKDIENDLSLRFDVYSELIIALDKKQFELYYQLQYDENKNICGAEALIRWNHPEKGLISPIRFIPIAEKTGLIVEIGQRVFREACKQLLSWQQNPKTSRWKLAVNVSAKQFGQDDFISVFKEIVVSSGIRADMLKVELTESLLVEDMKNVIDKMIKLKNMGIKISLDDFGTGYSSLQYLKHLPLDQIKIDQTFVLNMLEDNIDIAIIKTIITLGETFGFEVIAEGVETKEHYEYLKKLGCRYFQGYYFAKPEPIKVIDDIIQKL